MSAVIANRPATRRTKSTRKALDAASHVDTAAAAAPAEFITVPLASLCLSARNVRKVEPEGIDELAALILAQGLLQPLVVTRADDEASTGGPRYAVEAGGRRLRALQRLAERGQIAPDTPVECRLVPAERALEVSLAENSGREAMHPADQCEAFQSLAEAGLSAEGIAERFGVTVRTVQQRLRLARVAPELVDRFRAGELTLDQMQALAISDDHALQVAVWTQAEPWARQPWSLRAKLTAAEVPVTSEKARFVGLEAYEAAGGAIRRDLFGKDDDAFLTDSALLDRLFADRLQGEADAVREEGWAWVESRERFDHAERVTFGRIEPTVRPLSADEESLDARLREELESAEAALEAAHAQGEVAEDAGEEGLIERLETQSDALRAQIDELQAGLRVWTDEDRARAGAVVTVVRGELAVLRGLVRPGERSASDVGATSASAHPGTAPTKPAMSERLAQAVTSHRTAALAATMIQAPHTALAALAWRLSSAIESGDYYTLGAVRITVTDNASTLGRHAPDLPESLAGRALIQARARWSAVLPRDSLERLAWLAEQSEQTLIELIAWCTACSMDAVHGASGSGPHGIDAIARLLGLEMADWWRPDADHFFALMPKARIVEAVAEACGAEAARPITEMKKDEAAKHAEALVRETRWVPEPMRIGQSRVTLPESSGERGRDRSGLRFRLHAPGGW